MIQSSELLKQAHVAHAAGDLVNAARLACQVLAQSPLETGAQVLLGVIRGKEGKNEEAIKLFQQALKIQPDSFESLFWLSMIYRKTGDLDQAILFAQKAATVRPNDAHALNNLGLVLMAAGRLPEAETSFRKSATANPRMAPVLYNLGTVLQLQGKDKEAASAFEQSLALAPNNPDAYVALGHIALAADNPSGAVSKGQQAISMNPTLAGAYLLVALGLIHDGRSPEATPFLQKTIELAPNDANAIATLGSSLQTQGKIEEANAEFRKSIQTQPRQGYAYFALMHNKRVREEDRPMVQQMETLTKDATLTPKDINFLHYGLGKAYENLAEYEQAMHHLDEANRYAKQLKLGQKLFDKKEYAETFDRTIRLFSKEMMERFQRVEPTNGLPIFILGMMRSGTTLLEQILSSHPQVEAAGELAFWTSNARQAVSPQLTAVNPAELFRLANRYCEQLRKIGPTAKHVTDKMPANYLVIGFLHLAFPNSPIIHTRRNPADTCISIYATPNRRPIDFAHDKENITFAYEQYLRLMDHWRKVLPPDRMLEIDYENVVADRDSVTRRVLEYCKLDWDEACANPERNERTVVTPSVWQVRQPIYSSSVERWRHFEPWLGPFARLLPGKQS
ncbi:MAG TPA: sulfotransferase [Fimbriimonadaceae bacterium]|jgi:tetratricopeptide (TPR) repeat protein